MVLMQRRISKKLLSYAFLGTLEIAGSGTSDNSMVSVQQPLKLRSILIQNSIAARVKWFKSPQTNRLRDDTPAAIKNNNPEWHCLNTGSGCFICGSRDSAPGHYVNVHPNNEVVVSRLAPSVANFLRSLKYHPECKIINGGDRRLYEQLCYFCNESKCFCKSDWIDHIIRHTGHYTRQCGNCSNMSDADNCSRCKIKPTRTKNGRNLTGYLCDLCNFIRFNRTEIQNHLRNEHDDNSGMDDFEEIIFLTFPDYGKRRK